MEHKEKEDNTKQMYQEIIDGIQKMKQEAEKLKIKYQEKFSKSDTKNVNS